MLHIYGINNCDTVKKAKKELDELGLSYEMFDFKKKSPSESKIYQWKKEFGDWPINKRGTTYRKLSNDFLKAGEEEIVQLILNNLSVIKRPILEKKGKVLKIGFKPGDYKNI